MSNALESRPVKKATNLSISAELLERARQHDINLSATLEAALQQLLRDKEREQWRTENREAIAAYNSRVEQQGVFSDGARAF